MAQYKEILKEWNEKLKFTFKQCVCKHGWKDMH